MMELTTLECNLTAKPLVSQENTKSSISINIRRFRQIVQRKPNGYETVTKHRLVSSIAKVSYEVTPKRASNQEYIDKMLVRLIKKQTMKTWLRKRVSALISSKSSECMKDNKAYNVVVDVDVIFGKHKLVNNEINNSVKVEEEEEEKNCAICLGELSGGGECMEVQCSHVFHRECIWMWLRKKKMSCPTCRRCTCGEKSCSHGDVESDDEY